MPQPELVPAIRRAVEADLPVVVHLFSIQEDRLRMRILVTGSAGHLGEALVRALQNTNHEVVGLDILDSPFTSRVGSITDRSVVNQICATCARTPRSS